MKKIIFLAIAATALFSSCKKDEDNNKAGIFKGLRPKSLMAKHGHGYS